MNREELIKEVHKALQRKRSKRENLSLYDMAVISVDLVEKQNGWISPDLKESGKTVLCWYENSYSKTRVVRAVYYGKYQCEDCMGEEDEDWYDVKDGIYYVPAGWYEYNEGSDTQMFISEEIKGWQPLPLPPRVYELPPTEGV